MWFHGCSGDIDVLVTDEEHDLDTVRDRLLQRLFQCGLMTHRLTSDNDENFKFFGICRLGGALHRRIDLVFVPPGEWATALLYFTGSDLFNRAMRLRADKLGMSLSQHALRA